MNTNIELVKLLVDAVVNGRLMLKEKNRRVRFELVSEFCSASGPLIKRWDWVDRQGRPGLMSMIDQVEFECSNATYKELFKDSREYEDEVIDLLQERLAPDRLFVFDPYDGWLLTAFNSRTLEYAK
ncbi:hypothetical protein [Ruegeria sp. HKCCE4150]|uniref:hypothetical protein n=1 Tax=Ruegeria sp. HKCCE4150 TaxID=2794828 RepID=UPI001AE377DB|nr:hypothetical protein [Ruegeria sp. HKCCE4150]